MAPVANASIVINAPRERVWEALTVPDLMREYFLGATVTTDWEVGGPITFSGEWKGRRYEDKGEVITFEPQQELAYSHWSPMTGTEDIAENYHLIDITLDETAGGTEVRLEQSNATGTITDTDRANRGDYETTWRSMLEALKETAEKS